jgi:hypothetical protein
VGVEFCWENFVIDVENQLAIPHLPLSGSAEFCWENFPIDVENQLNIPHLSLSGCVEKRWENFVIDVENQLTIPHLPLSGCGVLEGKFRDLRGKSVKYSTFVTESGCVEKRWENFYDNMKPAS